MTYYVKERNLSVIHLLKVRHRAHIIEMIKKKQKETHGSPWRQCPWTQKTVWLTEKTMRHVGTCAEHFHPGGKHAHRASDSYPPYVISTLTVVFQMPHPQTALPSKGKRGHLGEANKRPYHASASDFIITHLMLKYKDFNIKFKYFVALLGTNYEGKSLNPQFPICSSTTWELFLSLSSFCS